jgi:hypothetical protein
MGNLFSFDTRREQILYINASESQKTAINFHLHKIISNYISENTHAPIKIHLVHMADPVKGAYIVYTYKGSDIFLNVETWKNIFNKATDLFYTLDYISTPNRFITINNQDYKSAGYLIIKIYKHKRTLKYEVKYIDKDGNYDADYEDNE